MKRHILFVENDRPYAKELTESLAEISPEWEVDTTTTWEEATERLLSEDRPYDCLLLDVMLPSSTGEVRDQTFDATGLEVLRQIRSKRIDKGPPVVTLTTQSTIDQEAIAAGADLCLRKPFGAKELNDVIQSMLIREDLKRQRRPIFVAHAFTKSQIDDLRSTISNALDGTPFSAYYADVDVIEGHILLDKILEKIRNTEFGIYEISASEKANVFLELGVSIGLGKPYYLIAKAGSNIPSDLAGLDRVEYDSFAQLATIIRDKIINQRLAGTGTEEKSER